MLKIIDYVMLRECDDQHKQTLEAQIQQHIKDGWQPYGSPFANYWMDGGYLGINSYWCQAMVKYANHDEPLLPVPEQYWDEMD